MILSVKITNFVPVFWRPVNPISTEGVHYTHLITACPPGFSDLAKALIVVHTFEGDIKSRENAGKE